MAVVRQSRDDVIPTIADLPVPSSMEGTSRVHLWPLDWLQHQVFLEWNSTRMKLTRRLLLTRTDRQLHSRPKADIQKALGRSVPKKERGTIGLHPLGCTIAREGRNIVLVL